MSKTVDVTLDDDITNLVEPIEVSYHFSWEGERSKHWYVVDQIDMKSSFLNSDDLRVIANKLDELDKESK